VIGDALGMIARVTAAGALAACVDPGDRLDPASVGSAGADLTRLLWLRGDRHVPRALPEAVSATATLAWLVHGDPVHDLWGVARSALVLGSVLGFWNLLYDVVALESGILRVYNQPWAEGKPAAAIALDYAPWFFGGFGAIYGAGLGALEWLAASGSLAGLVFALAFTLLVASSLLLPVAGYVLQSRRRHGHWGTRPVKKGCPSA